MLLGSQRLIKPYKLTKISNNYKRTLFTTQYLLSKTSDKIPNNHQFNNTLLLPKTDFPLRNDILKTEAKYRAKLSEELYDWQLKNNNGEQFILHDGPPYANGDLHLGHALNKIIKDIINRWELLKGKKINYIPGWDCHGLPIELKVTSKLKGKKLQPLETRQLARDLALNTVKSQLQEFKSYGIMADWNTTYKTLSKDYVIRQLKVVKNLVQKGIFYRQFRPVYWSPSSQTALAESELEYNEKHTSKSIYVKFELNNKDNGLVKEFDNINLLIWTTTPWTLPANQAVSVNPELNYSVVKTLENVNYVVATDLIPKLEPILGELTTLKQFQGSDLNSLTYINPLTNQNCPILMGNHVTNVSGTGLVHTAPAHGMDDYLVCKAQGIQPVNLVNDYGKYNTDAGDELSGKSVLGEGNQIIIDKLTNMGHLIHLKEIIHSYPYDWRTKKPVIQRATPQWFANLEGLSSKALDSLENIETIPPSGKNRLKSFLGLRTEWCVSRQRAWGVPIPVFYDSENGDALLTPDSIDFVIEKLENFDIDAWWTLPETELIHPKYLESGKNYVKGYDTLDVWFDSGTSWTLINELFPREQSQPVADVYFEGSDQHRGWFQSSLLTSISQVNKAPFKTLITHGFVLDNKGQKMSKSLGNIIEPKTIINGNKGFPLYGADLLRYWASSSEFVKEVSVGKESLKIINNSFKKLRNTSRFLLGNLNEFDPKTQTIEYDNLTDLDKFALHQLYQFQQKITQHYNKYQFNQVVQELNRYTANDLSSFYLDCRKDRLYADSPSSIERLSTQTVLFEILKVYNQVLAPLVPHLAEEIFDYSKKLYELKSPENPSVFHNQWSKLPSEWNKSNTEFEKFWQFNLKLRNLANRVIGQARDNGYLKSSLEIELLLSLSNSPSTNIQFNEFELSQLFITSNCKIVNPQEFNATNIEFKLEEIITFGDDKDIKVNLGVQKSNGFKCPRCWVYSSKSENCLCERCSKVVKV